MLNVKVKIRDMGIRINDEIDEQYLNMEFQVSGDLLQVYTDVDAYEKKVTNKLNRLIQKNLNLYNAEENQKSFRLDDDDMALWELLIYNTANVTYDFLVFMFKVRKEEEYFKLKDWKAYNVLSGLYGMTTGGLVSTVGLNFKEDEEPVIDEDVYIIFKPGTYNENNQYLDPLVVISAGRWSGRMIGKKGSNINELKSIFKERLNTNITLIGTQTNEAENT